MASIYERKNSRFIWIKFRDPLTNKIRRESTEFLADDRIHRQRARELCAEKTFAESQTPRSTSAHRWDQWVPGFLQQRHALVASTLARKTAAWRQLSEYLLTIKVQTPQQLTRQHCLDYVAWRKAKGHLNSPHQRRISHNTVLMELKCLSSIMQEAVRRQWCSANVCHRLEIARELPREKTELSNDQIRFIRSEIQKRKARAKSDHDRATSDFLEISFEIALAQGCRMAETYLPLSAINLEQMEITFTAKGNQRYIAPINPSLVPLLKRLQSEKRTHTYQRPRMGSLLWFKFFSRLRLKRHDLRNASFHSTRVTVVSRAERAGVPEKVAMALVNHSSTTVHRVYRKIKKTELSAVWGALRPLAGKPSASSSSTGNSPC